MEDRLLMQQVQESCTYADHDDPESVVQDFAAANGMDADDLYERYCRWLSVQPVTI